MAPTVKRCVALMRARPWAGKTIEAVGHHAADPLDSLALPSTTKAIVVRVTSSNSDHAPTTSTAYMTLANRRLGVTI